MTKCDGCPILNTDLFWVEKGTRKIVQYSPEMRSHQKDFDLINASDNCELICITYKDKKYTPKKVMDE